VYFIVNFNVFFKLIKVHLLVSELYVYQNARCNNKNTYWPSYDAQDRCKNIRKCSRSVTFVHLEFK